MPAWPSFDKSMGEALKNDKPLARSSSFSCASWGRFIFCTLTTSASTLSLVASSTHSKRRNRVKGKIIRPYWLCLKSPRSRSAIDQQ